MNKTELLALPQVDLRHIKYGECSSTEWDTLIHAMNMSHVVRIDASIYDYFLEVLPPLTMFPGGFVFCEGIDHPRYFYYLGDEEGYVCRTDHTKTVDSSAYIYDDWRGPTKLKPTL